MPLYTRILNHKLSTQHFKKSEFITIITITKAMFWAQCDTNYLYGTYKTPDTRNTKLACFDLDDTIITTQSGKKFAMNIDDWKFMIPKFIDKLKSLTDYSIVIITNQKGISTGKVNIDEWKMKIEQILTIIDLPMRIFALIHDNIYRKPYPTLWHEIEYDKSESFYCGDACGREGDFSDSDLKFALNGDVTFYTPEDFVIGVKSNIPINYPNLSSYNKEYIFQPNNREMIIMVGIQGSGKSTFALKTGYERINQDTLKTKAKCIKETEKILKSGKNIVIDNTNLTEESRNEYITLANKYGYQYRIIVIDTPLEIAKHLNHHRYYTSRGQVKLIPELVYRMSTKKYVPPSKNVEFVPFCYDMTDRHYYYNI